MSDRLRACWLALWLGLATTGQAAEVGMLTGLRGQAQQLPVSGAARALQPFTKVQEGERLRLAADAQLQLVFFASGLEQRWSGPAELRIQTDGAQLQGAGAPPQVRQLPRLLVRQLARTPAPDGQGRAGMVRLRSMPAGGTLESVEKNYTQLRQDALADDRNPELYLLAGYFELREFERLEQLLAKMDSRYPSDPEIDLLRSLYMRAMNNARMAAEQ